MSSISFQDGIKISCDFFDKIDFKAFIKGDLVDLRHLMDDLEKFYDREHPDRLPPEFEGCIFNFIEEYEFATYMNNRYGCKVYRNVVEVFTLSFDHEEKMNEFKKGDQI